MCLTPKQTAIAAWFIVTIFIGGVGGSHIVPSLIYLHELGEANRTVSGEIIETYPRMHGSCKYRFVVDGKAYEGIGRSCGTAEIGQKATIYFSPNDPEKSVNGDPNELFLNDLIPFSAAFLLFPIFAAVVSGKRAKNRCSNAGSEAA